MRDIYSRAEEVLIWLGPPTLHKNAHLAFSACKQFAVRMRLAIYRLAYTGLEDANRIAVEAVDLALRSRPFTGAESGALVEILRQPYWSHVWVVQEMCVTKAARIHAGRQSIPWDDFGLVLIMMERCMPWIMRLLDSNFRALLELRRLCHEEKLATRPQLANLLPQFRWSRATNPKDKIYGLLGLAQSHDCDLVEVDYKISPSECYTRVMFALLQQSRDLSLLIYCNTPSFIHSDLVLPSWVPNWSFDSSNLPSPRRGLSEGNLYHRLSAIKKDIYEGYQASGNSECPTPKLRDGPDGAVLILRGLLTARISQVAPAMQLHHQLLQVKGMCEVYEPVPPFSWEEFLNHYWGRLVWKMLTTRFIPSFFLFSWNCYRKGAALDVLLTSASLAQSPETWLGKEGDPLKVLFITMMKGRQSHKYIQDRVKGAFSDDIIQEMADEFQNFQNSLRWNLLLKLVTLVGISRLFPSILFSLLGLSYEHHRGTFHLSGIVIWLLYLMAVRLSDYVPGLLSIFPPLFVYGLYMSARPIFAPVMPTRFALVFPAVLDYQLARTGGGRLALVPHNTQIGDRIALLQGGKCPFVVRSRKLQSELMCDSCFWELIGDSYVYDMMEGEEWREEACGEMEFV